MSQHTHHRGSDEGKPAGQRETTRKQTVLKMVALQLVLGLIGAALVVLFSVQIAVAILCGTAVSVLASGIFGWIAALPGEDSSGGRILIIFMLGEFAKLAAVVLGFTALFIHVEFLRQGPYAVVALFTFLLMTVLAYGATPRLDADSIRQQGE